MTSSTDWILVTNDDGVGAPGLVSLAEAINKKAPVRVVVPDRERSWVGKAITRFDPVEVTVVNRQGVEIHSVNGYPADCVQLGIHTLFETPPVLVVSGINIGYNHGSAFLQTSGTVGAALEASIAGIASVAFSTGSKAAWDPWRASVETEDAAEMWRQLAEIASGIAEVMLHDPDPGLLLSVNIPDDADETTERRLTTIASIGYDRLFREQSPGTYVHDFGGGIQYRDTLEGTDIQAALDEVISITPIRSAHAVAPAPGLVARLAVEASR